MLHLTLLVLQPYSYPNPNFILTLMLPLRISLSKLSQLLIETKLVYNISHTIR